MSSKVKFTASEEDVSALVPGQRFPEFRDTAAWKLMRLSHFLSESRLSGSKGDVARKITVKLWGGGVFAKNDAIQGSANTQYFRRKSGQLIYSKLDFLNQAFGIIPEELDGYESTADLPCFDVSADVNAEFLLECVKQKEFYLRVGEAADGSRIAKRIHPETFLASEIPLPSLLEQNKIADCLDSVAALIAAQGRKVEALKAHKKGLMQQLFPQEGETQPRLRFPEFRDAGEWQEVSLSDYFDPIRNGFVGTATPYYTTSEGVRYLQGRNIKQGRIEADNLIFITKDFHNRQRKSHLKPGDILMVQSGHVGECAVIGPEFAGSNCHALIILTPKRKLCPEFFTNYFYSPIGKLTIFQITTGNTIKHILASELKTLSVIVPDLAEQQRIADSLTSLDDLIAAETQKLDRLKIHKKGLMQQLFPQVGEDDA